LGKLPAYISTIAAIIVLLACIAIEAELLQMAIWLSTTIAVFYVIGAVARLVLLAKVFPPQEDAAETDEDDDDDDDDEEDEDEDYDEDDEQADEDLENTPVENAFLDS